MLKNYRFSLLFKI